MLIVEGDEINVHWGGRFKEIFIQEGNEKQCSLRRQMKKNVYWGRKWKKNFHSRGRWKKMFIEEGVRLFIKRVH